MRVPRSLLAAALAALMLIPAVAAAEPWPRAVKRVGFQLGLRTKTWGGKPATTPIRSATTVAAAQKTGRETAVVGVTVTARAAAETDVLVQASAEGRLSAESPLLVGDRERRHLLYPRGASARSVAILLALRSRKDVERDLCRIEVWVVDSQTKAAIAHAVFPAEQLDPASPLCGA